MLVLGGKGGKSILRLDYKMTNNDYLEFNIYHMENSDEIKKSLLVSRVFLSFIIVGVAFLAVRGHKQTYEKI